MLFLIEIASLFWCARRDLNPYAIGTRTSNVPVCQFQHSRNYKGYYSTLLSGCQSAFTILFQNFYFSYKSNNRKQFA